MADNIGWEKILATALVASFFTACVTEPVKAWLKRRQFRRCLYFEIMKNYGALTGQIKMAEHDPEMKNGIGQRFAMGFNRIAYDIMLKDAPAFYSLGYYEVYWIELLYRDFEHVIHGCFDPEETRLRCAGYVAHSVLNNLKNRQMSKRLMFSVSPEWMKEDLRQNLPLTDYIDIDPPTLRERLLRRCDRLQYRIWRNFYPPRT